MGRLRVLMTIPNLHGGGAERIALQMHQAFDRSTIDPVLLIQERFGSYVSAAEGDPSIMFINEGHYRRRQLPRSLFATWLAARQADVLIGGNEGRPSAAALIAAKLTGRPVVMWLHNDWERFSKHVSWRQRLALRLYHRADAIIACSDGVANAFSKLLPASAHLVRTIYHGMPVSRIREAAEEPLPLEHAAIFANPVVLNVGRLDYQKGQDTLIDAHASLRQRGSNHHLVILGVGPLQGQLQEQVNRLGVADSVHFLGFQANPFKYMKAARVFALSSRFEGAPLVLAEAFACGLPIVAADCRAGPMEMLDGGRYGHLVPVDDAQALADALEPVLANDAEALRLADLSLRRSEAFSQSRMIREWQDLLAAVVAAHRGSGVKKNSTDRPPSAAP